MKVEVIPESEAERPLVFSGLAAEVHRALAGIQPGQVVRVTSDSARTQGVGAALARYAKKSPYRVETWRVDGVYYVKRLPDAVAAETTPEPVKLPPPGRCPRCSGNLVRSRELDGVMVKCLACGFEPSETPEEAGIITERKIFRQPRLNGARV